MDLEAALGSALMAIGGFLLPRKHENTKQRGGVTLLVTVLLFVVSHNAFAGDKYAVLITGASGGEAYAQKYDKWRASFTDLLREKFGYSPERLVVLTESGGQGMEKATREQVQRVFAELRRKLTKEDQLLVFLIGHGTTADGEDAKFNLVGPDLSATEWANLLRPIPGRLVFVNTTSASFPFLRKLAARGRVVMTATDASAQQFETVFPEFFLKAFEDGGADLDKSGRVSFWEAFTFASAGVRGWFEQKGQLPTERPLLDDTGAGVGREAQNAGVDGAVARVTYLAPDAVLTLPSDATQAALVKRRADLERQVEELKARKESTPTEQYDAELEKVLVELARISAQIRAKS
jgi:hypothetical protein